jgi:alkylation response protein AidB-like acyl-CoA dehydrogenase
MDLVLTETQRLLHEATARFVRQRCSFEERRKILAVPPGTVPPLWGALADLGLTGVEIDERFGGSGGTFKDLAVVFEAFGRGLVVDPLLATAVLGAGLIARLGTPIQKQAMLPGIASGARRVALAHSEPAARYDLAYVETTAIERDGDFILNGRKSMVLGGDCADTFIVSARTARGPGDPVGISLFLVDGGTTGLRVRAYANFDGTRAADLTMERVRLPPSSLLGPLGEAFPGIDHAADRGIAALCCEAVGAMAALNELTLDYLKIRRQFGQPLGKFQVLQHRMVDMTMALHQAEAMAVLAADHAGLEDRNRRAKAISAAKVQVAKSAQIVGRGAIQLHGGIGLTEEYGASHYFKRLTAIEMMFGDIDHHLARFASL